MACSARSTVVLLTLSACSHTTPAAGQSPRSPRTDTPAVSAASAGSSTPRDAVVSVCETPAGRAQLAQLPGAAPCGNRAMGLATVTVRGRRLAVLGRAADPCCTDTGPTEMHAGWQAWLDGAPYRHQDHGGAPLWTALAPFGDLRGDDLTGFLQAMLLVRGALPQAVTAAQGAALVARWPAAGPALRRHPPGLVREGGTTFLRAWSEQRESERGVSCHRLERHEVGVGADGRVVFRDPVVYGEGRSLGGPCADPLPRE